ncbi:MAG: DUF1214 domain-containing protein [Gammaproteobacteria bacterium]
MACGDGSFDAPLQSAWHRFCDQLKQCGDLVFKDTNPASSLQRADGFRFLTQNLGQAFDLALETKDPRYPALNAFCTPNRKLGSDNADFTYLQAWIDGRSAYRISGRRGSARFFNLTVQGVRPDTVTIAGSPFRNLHEPFGDTPEANLFGHQIHAEWDGSFVLHVGGPRRGPNWLPTTPASRKLFLRQGFDRWDEEPAQLRIERIDMDAPRPVPTHETILEAVRWAGDFLHGCMRDWPDHPLESARRTGEDMPLNAYPAPAADAGDGRRGRVLANMHWRLAADEALIVEFERSDAFWMFTNMGAFMNSMDYAYRSVSFTPARTAVDADGQIRLVLAHEDPGCHNWIDTQGFEEGYLTCRVVQSPALPALRTRVCRFAELAAVLPPDSRKVTAQERRLQLQERFDAIRRRYRV